MPGFMSNNTALTVYKTDKADPAKFSHILPALEARAFPWDIQSDGVRFGWVGLGDPLDYTFNLGLEASELPAFSLRVDTRKASAAAVKLQFAEALREKEAGGEKLKSKDRKALKEAITAKLTSQAPFIPTLTDCIWDMSAARLYVASASAKSLQAVLSLFETTFGVQPQALIPKSDMTAIFAEICRSGEFPCRDYVLTPFGTASLATSQQEEDKALIAVQNNLQAVASALDEGLKIQKLRVVATPATGEPDVRLDFTVDAALSVSGLLLPKSEKGASPFDDFYLKSENCVRAANILEGLASL